MIVFIKCTVVFCGTYNFIQFIILCDCWRNVCVLKKCLIEFHLRNINCRPDIVDSFIVWNIAKQTRLLILKNRLNFSTSKPNFSWNFSEGVPLTVTKISKYVEYWIDSSFFVKKCVVSSTRSPWSRLV